MSQKPLQNKLETTAQRLAMACRRVIQGCLREEEWRDADNEFTAIILNGLKSLHSKSSRRS